MTAPDTNPGTAFPFGKNTTGRLLLPGGDAPAPTVLLLHGFASHADEVGDFYLRLAEALASVGIATLRFTFRNFELSPEERVVSSVPELIAEAEAALDALAAQPQIAAARIGLLGFSLGGAVAVLTVAGRQTQVKSLATWSCAADLERSFRQAVGVEIFDLALAGEEVHLDLGWRKIRMGPTFFRSMVGQRPEEVIGRWPGPFLAIAGSDDPLSGYLDQYVRNAAGSVKEGVLIEGADHIFNVLETPERFVPGVIEKTVAWFKQTL